MREIKFRVWDGYKMHYPPVVEIGVCGVNGLTSASFQSENGGYTTSAYVMQFTGLHDKNGKEIYEGDVVRHPDGSVFCVVWSSSDCAFRAWYPTDPKYIMSSIMLQIGKKGLAIVIGNIHDNPELMESEQGGI